MKNPQITKFREDILPLAGSVMIRLIPLLDAGKIEEAKEALRTLYVDLMGITDRMEDLPEVPAPTSDLKLVTNAWTIYSDNGKEKGKWFASVGRPQDWGNSKIWMYRVYHFEALGYRNEVHCWLDHHVEDYKHMEIFAALIVQILRPGTRREFCGREFMHEDDFWSEEWGEMPPFHFANRQADFD